MYISTMDIYTDYLELVVPGTGLAGALVAMALLKSLLFGGGRFDATLSCVIF